MEPGERSLGQSHQQSSLCPGLKKEEEGRAQLEIRQQQTKMSPEPSCEAAGATKAILDVCERRSQTLLVVVAAAETDSESVCQVVRQGLGKNDFCRDQDTSTEQLQLQQAEHLPSCVLVAAEEDSHGRDLTKEMNS